jgi:primosomal protein N' (replication factor Y) (superfamily II helicase)
MLPVHALASPVRWFDDAMLEVCRWVSERYLAPLATVLQRATPPRVVSEERAPAAQALPVTRGHVDPPGPLRSYRNAARMLEGIERFAPADWILRPAPEDEAAVAVDAVAVCLEAGRRALVVVPEAAPIPGVARALADVFGERCRLLLGGSKRSRARAWLDIQAGANDVVVGTRPSVFAPVPELGLIYVSRESHPALREDRAPYYHVRDVALTRGRVQHLTVVLAGVCPSTEAAAHRFPEIAPTTRRWPPVELVRPGPEGRAPRLVRALRATTRGFLFSPIPGYGIAAVCRACGRPAACAACGGPLRSASGTVRCTVCEASGRCRHCGARDFGIRRGGRERVEEWAARLAPVPVRRLSAHDEPRLPSADEILVGGPDDVRDFGPDQLELVAILDADLAERRPGLMARERAVTTWMEAIAWAAPSGRAIVQSSRSSDPAIQALVRGNPDRFHADEAHRRGDAGFPVGAAVFRVAGGPGSAARLRELEPPTLLVSEEEGTTVCLLALDPGRVPAFGEAVRALAAEGVVTRVEAEPHL